LRQVSTLLEKSDHSFTNNRLLGFIGPVPPPARDKRVSVQIPIIRNQKMDVKYYCFYRKKLFRLQAHLGMMKGIFKIIRIDY
jgi:hypothetical protein